MVRKRLDRLRPVRAAPRMQIVVNHKLIKTSVGSITVGEINSVLVTGANGFVGTALTQVLLERGLRVRMTGQVRSEALEGMGAEWFPMPDLTGEVDWTDALAGMDAVVHLAAIAHRTGAVVPEDWVRYDQVNHLATRSLAEAIRQTPILDRFLFVSTVRVHGDPVAFPVREDSPFAPSTPYDQSKMDAERAIRETLPLDAARWAIIRPVLVYGPGNRGNMAKLEGLIRTGIPVPLGKRPNRRSFLFLGNLLGAILAFLVHPMPPSGRTWIVADEEPASTERLLRAMAGAMGRKARVLHLPSIVLDPLTALGDLCRKIKVPVPWNSETRQKLLGDFYVDISAIKAELGWTPPFSLEEGIRRTYGLDE